MKIEYFKLENFKSFTTENNKIGHTNSINFIYGDNNSGKSNILKFLNLIFTSKLEKDTITIDNVVQTRYYNGNFFEGVIDNEPYIYHKNKRDVNITFEFLIIINKIELRENFDFYDNLEAEYFNNGNTETKIKFSGKIYSIDNKGASFIELKNVSIDAQEAYVSEDQNKFYFRGKPSLDGNSSVYGRLMSYFNDCVLYIDNNRYFINEKYLLKNNVLSPDNYKNWLYNYSLDTYSFDDYQNLLNFIRSFKIGKLVDVENLDLSFSIDSENNLELMLNKGDDRLPITSFGTGVNQILYILTKIFLTKSRILIIEELELNLSPKTQKEIFKIFRTLIDKKVIDQLFFTSHSSFFNFRNDFSLYEVSIDGNKVSSISKKTGITGVSFWLNRIID